MKKLFLLSVIFLMSFSSFKDRKDFNSVVKLKKYNLISNQISENLILETDFKIKIWLSYPPLRGGIEIETSTIRPTLNPINTISAPIEKF